MNFGLFDHGFKITLKMSKQNYKQQSMKPIDKYSTSIPKYFGLSKRNSYFDNFDKTLPGPGTHQQKRMNKTICPEWKIGQSSGRNTFLEIKDTPSPQDYKIKPKSVNKQSHAYSIPQSIIDHQIPESSGFIYHPNKNLVKDSSPQFSFGYAEENDYSTPVPPPGMYQTGFSFKNSKFNTKERFFSSCERPPPYGEEATFPGPGKYQNPKPINKGPSYSFKKSEKIESQGYIRPFPFYDLSTKPFPNAGKTIGKLFQTGQITIPEDNPAPNAYSPKMKTHSYQAFIQKSKRSPLENPAITINPSPNQYNTIIQDNRHRLTFYKQKRQLEKRQETLGPGPAAYSTTSTLSNTAGVMGKKLQNLKAFDPPSPSQYDINIDAVKTKTKAAINLRSNRSDFSKTITGDKIGPGSYETITSDRASLGKMSKSLRLTPKPKGIEPGPGFYDLPSYIGKLSKFYNGKSKLNPEGYSVHDLKVKEKQKSKMEYQSFIQKKNSQKQTIKATQEIAN